MSQEGGVQFFNEYFVQAGTVAIGDRDSGYGIAGTVDIGDRDSRGAYSWNSAEGLGQQARVLWLYRRRMLRVCELTWKGCSKQEKGAAEAANREYEAKLERLRKERSMGTSFDGQGGGGSADRGGTAATTMGLMWTRGVRVGGGLRQGLSYVPRGVVPKFPAECPPYVYIAWERGFDVFLANQGLGHTISPDASLITAISCVDDAYLFGHFGEALVTEHRRVWGYICEVTAGAPFENRLYECHSVWML